MHFIKSLTRKEQGQGMVEYGIILGLVSVLAIGALTAMGGDINTLFGIIQTALAAIPGV